MLLKIDSFFLLSFFIQQSLTQTPPVVPLTSKLTFFSYFFYIHFYLDALTAVYCHHSDEPGIMTIRCRPNEKIRMLDAFDAAAKNKSRLPIQCLKEKRFRIDSSGVDCKVHTSFTSACSGRENCTLHMQRIRLNNANENCQNAFVDYTMAFFECISGINTKTRHF
jgi:hypothetical protein